MRLLTNDLYEGAWLLSQGVELSDLWMDDKARRAVIFEFAGENVLDLQNEYKKGKAEVNVVKLKGALKELKDRMFWLIRTKEVNPPKCEAFGRVNETQSRKRDQYARATQAGQWS